MGNFLSKNPDMDGYGSGRKGWSGVGLRILSREGLYSSIRFDWYATWVKPWPWPEVKFWTWPFKVMLYMFRCVLTRQTRWCQNYCSIISNTSYHWKTVLLKNAVFDLSWPLTLKRLILGEICRHHGKRAFRELSFAFFGFGVAIIVREIMAGIPDKTIIFRKFDLWWPLLTSIFAWAKNYRNDFERAH